jgi:CubicO group peptidase (beta-lactamase class C family)
MQTRIFDPLVMKDTAFFPPESRARRLAAACTYHDGKGLQRFPDQPIVDCPMVYSADYPARVEEALCGRGRPLLDSDGLRALQPDDSQGRRA